MASLLERIDLQEIQEDLHLLFDHVQQVRFLASPLLSLTSKHDKFFYQLGSYEKEISRESVLAILEHAFVRGDHCYP